MINTLKDVTVDEVSLVGNPAVPGAKFLLYKSMDVDTMTEIEKKMKPEAEEKPEDEMNEEEDEQEMEEESGTEAHGKKKGKKSKEVKKMEPIDTISKSEVDTLIQKEIAAVLEKAAAEKAELQKQYDVVSKALEIEKSVRITKQFVDLAKSDMPNLTGASSEVMGPVLKEMSEKLSTETYTALYNVLKSASAYIGENDVMTKELGTSSSSVGSAYEKLNAIATGLVSKDSSMTSAKAFLKAYGDNPELARAYDREYNGGA